MFGIEWNGLLPDGTEIFVGLAGPVAFVALLTWVLVIDPIRAYRYHRARRVPRAHDPRLDRVTPLRPDHERLCRPVVASSLGGAPPWCERSSGGATSRRRCGTCDGDIAA